MKKILALSILITVLSSCMHGGHHGMKGGCGKDKPCMMESKEGKPTECEDCKKTK